jgi:hypothetical protein
MQLTMFFLSEVKPYDDERHTTAAKAPNQAIMGGRCHHHGVFCGAAIVVWHRLSTARATTRPRVREKDRTVIR